MSEKDLDSSINDYNEINDPKGYFKQLEWDMAIGLQEVDNLEPSKYLEELIEKSILGELTIEEVEKELKDYYIEKEKQNSINYNELECDFVSMRIVELLEKDDFELSLDYLKYIHKYLFQDVYEFAGKFRNINFFKHEIILNNDSVAYVDCKTLTESLEYDIRLEKEKNYKDMSIVDVIKNITDFSSSIWQVHPFREGNTRTTAVFIEKYLISLGYNVDNSLFIDKSVYFRNALVRSNYFNNDLSIKEDKSYLIKFYENLLLGKNNNLHSEDLIVKNYLLIKRGNNMSDDTKKVIRDFISYLNSDTIKYSFNNGGWSYDSKVYDFISYCYENNIVLKYDNIEERKELQKKDIEEMSKVELRKYLFMLFSGERFSSGMIMQSIKSGKLKLSLEKLLDD